MPGPEDGSATTLDEFVGQAFGDFGSNESEPPASSDPGAAAGAPPAEHPPETTEPVAGAPAGPDGSDPAERTGTPPSDAAAAPAAPPADADPLADAKPATYTVNGEVRTYDGIKVLGEDGAIIDAAALPDLMRRLGERDHLFETNRAQYQQVQQLERLSEWRTRDAEGKEQVIRGAEGLQTMRVQHAMLAASFDTLASIFKDPAKFTSLVSVDVDGNGGIQVTPNQAALQHLLTESDLAESRAEKAIREQLQILSAPPQSTGPADYSQHAPKVIAQAAGALDSHLTADDRSLLSAQMARYVRPVTEADRQQNPTLRLGSPIVDAAFTQVVTALAQVRSQAKATATAATTAATSNAAKLAAAARGKPAIPAAPARPARPVSPTATRVSDSDAAWDHMENLISPRRSA